RMLGTRWSSTHQNEKKMALLSAMNTTCMTNAPRCAIAARTLVANSASAKRNSPRHVECVIRSSSVQVQRACCAPEYEMRRDPRHREPRGQPEGQLDSAHERSGE